MALIITLLVVLVVAVVWAIAMVVIQDWLWHASGKAIEKKVMKKLIPEIKPTALPERLHYALQYEPLVDFLHAYLAIKTTCEAPTPKQPVSETKPQGFGQRLVKFGLMFRPLSSELDSQLELEELARLVKAYMVLRVFRWPYYYGEDFVFPTALAPRLRLFANHAYWQAELTDQIEKAIHLPDKGYQKAGLFDHPFGHWAHELVWYFYRDNADDQTKFAGAIETMTKIKAHIAGLLGQPAEPVHALDMARLLQLWYEIEITLQRLYPQQYEAVEPKSQPVNATASAPFPYLQEMQALVASAYPVDLLAQAIQSEMEEKVSQQVQAKQEKAKQDYPSYKLNVSVWFSLEGQLNRWELVPVLDKTDQLHGEGNLDIAAIRQHRYQEVIKDEDPEKVRLALKLLEPEILALVPTL